MPLLITQKLTTTGELYLHQVYTVKNYPALQVLSLEQELRQKTHTSSFAKIDLLLILKKGKKTLEEAVKEYQEYLDRIIAIMWQLNQKALQ